MQLNINTSATVRFTNILEKMHRSALPSAIRGALNNAVYDVKTRTMPLNSRQTFESRQQNFFKANSRFESASGFNVNTMRATVGFVETGLRGNSNFAVKDLKQQEQGGIIQKKSFIPLGPSRVGGNKSKPVKANARLSQIKNIVDARKVAGKNSKQKFVHAVTKAGVGGFVLSELNNQSILWKVNSLKRTDTGNFKLTALYSFKENRSVYVRHTGFMKKASLQSEDKMSYFFEKEAKRQIDKLGK